MHPSRSFPFLLFWEKEIIKITKGPLTAYSLVGHLTLTGRFSSIRKRGLRKKVAVFLAICNSLPKDNDALLGEIRFYLCYYWHFHFIINEIGKLNCQGILGGISLHFYGGAISDVILFLEQYAWLCCSFMFLETI